MTKEFLRMKLSDLVPYENNPRHNEEAVDATIASMQQCGNIDPIEVDENNVILSGHTRRLARIKMGYEESDVVRVSGLTDLQKKKYRILANKTNEFAGWDFDKLEEELDGLDFEGFDFGFETVPGLMDAMSEQFGISGENKDAGFTVVSLTFEKDEGEEVRSFISKNGQEGCLQTLLNYVRGL